MAAGQGSSSSSSSSSAAAVPTAMDIEDSLNDNMVIESESVVPTDELVYSQIALNRITQEHKQIHLETFGVPLSPDQPIPQRVNSGDARADEQGVIQARLKSNNKLVGFCIIALSTSAHTADVWSVCKDKTVSVPGVFEFLIRKFLERNPPAVRLSLVVWSKSDESMTEMGRLFLYSSLGFRLYSGQPIQDIYGNELIVVSHPNANEVVVQKTHSTSERTTLYIGMLRSRPGNELKMVATRESLMSPKTRLLHTQTQPFPVTITNDFRNAEFPIPDLVYITLYHMGLRRTGNQFETFKLPPNVTLVTFSMPGAVLYGKISAFSSIVQMIMRSAYPVFVKKFQGYSSFPLYSISKQEFASSSALQESVKATQFMLQFERRRILTICLPESVPRKQTQFDIQTYAPGMTCLNYNMGWNPRVQTDVDSGAGTYSTDPKSDIKRRVDLDAMVAGNTKLSEYIAALNRGHPENPKITLFLFGCSTVDDQQSYSLFYELSHRRSLNYTVSGQSPTFLGDIQPFLTTPDGIPRNLLPSCPPHPPQSSSSSSSGRGRRRLLSGPKRTVRRSSSSSKKRYTRRQRASRS